MATILFEKLVGTWTLAQHIPGHSEQMKKTDRKSHHEILPFPRLDRTDTKPAGYF